MAYIVFKFALTAAIVVAVSEIAKRSSLFGALIASLPLTSVLAIVWLYVDTGDTQKIGDLASSILWLVIPSMAFFVVLPFMLRYGIGFWISLFVACAATAGAYLLSISLLK